MKKLLIACLCGFAALATVPSCKKKDDYVAPTPNPTPGSNKIDLISRTWKMTYSQAEPPGIPDTAGNFITDIYDSLQPCVRDNLLLFTTTATYVINEGDLRCRPSDPANMQVGTWSFVNNEAQISQRHYISVTIPSKKNPLVDSSKSVQVELISSLDSVTDTRLRLTYPLVVNGQTYTVATGYVGVEE